MFKILASISMGRIPALVGVVVLLIVFLAVPVQADSIAISETVTATLTTTATADPAVFLASFAGSGVDSVFGAFTTTNTGTTTFSSPTAFTIGRTFVDIFAGGTLFGTLTGNGTETGSTSITTFNDVITGGTGIFAGDTGQITGTSTCTSTSPGTSSCTSTSTGSITTPEPSSLALMLAGTGILPLIRKRLARGRQAT